MQVELQNTKICYPEVETWFICWDDTRENIMAYGSILPTQCMESKWTQVDYYIDEEAWKLVLAEHDIIINDLENLDTPPEL